MAGERPVPECGGTGADDRGKALQAEVERWPFDVDPLHLLQSLREMWEPPGKMAKPGRRHLQLIDPARKRRGAVVLTFGWVP